MGGATVIFCNVLMEYSGYGLCFPSFWTALFLVPWPGEHTLAGVLFICACWHFQVASVF